MGNSSKIFGFLFNPKYEPFLVTGGLYLFTALYYTRKPVLQIVSFALLIIVTAYWGFAIRRVNIMTRRDFKITSRKLWLQVFIAGVLVVLGWCYFWLYNRWTRGIQIEWGYGGSISAVLVVLVVSTAEEIYFRGYLQNRLRSHHKLWWRVGIAVFVMAFYKVIVHMWEGVPLIYQLELLGIGILHNVLPSLWMEWSDNLIGPLLLHVFWDLLVYAPMGVVPYWVF
jgi:membrane protease YdiL (CAAX protease family)